MDFKTESKRAYDVFMKAYTSWAENCVDDVVTKKELREALEHAMEDVKD